MIRSQLHTHTHTPSDDLSICVLTKEFVENDEEAAVRRKKPSKVRRPKSKQQVGRGRGSNSPAPAGVTCPSLGEAPPDAPHYVGRLSSEVSPTP